MKQSGLCDNDMTWGEVKLAALRHIYSNEGATLAKDDGNTDYINAMPDFANEGLMILATVGKPIKKSWQIVISADVTEAQTGAGVLTLPVTVGSRYKIPLKGYITDFRALIPAEIYLEQDGAYGQTDDWTLEGDGVFVISGETAGTWTLWYAAYPATVTAATAETVKLGLSPEAEALLPLYIAYMCYKDDDLSMATQFHNDFEDGLTKLQFSASREPAGGAMGRVKNTSGWW